MHFFITRGRSCSADEHSNDKYLPVKLNDSIPGFALSQGQLLLDAPYSTTLRKLVIQCLAVSWALRPTGRQLLIEIAAALKVIEDKRDAGT
jgi:hypothetical protein